MRDQGLFDPARLVFIDETATSTNMVRLRGRCPRGERLIGYVPQGHWKTVTFVAGLRNKKMVAPFVVDGPMTRANFLAYIEQCLRPTPNETAALSLRLRRLDRLHLEFPFAGSRMLRGLLAAEGCKVGRRHVKTLMRRMAIEALYRRPRTTKPEPGHKIYPYLLRGMEATRPNQVWAMDITYIPMARGFVYLAVVLDWFSRRVLSWRLSITMEAAFCVATLEDALARHGKPEIFNTDQGSQFTGSAFTSVLANNDIAISMDGKGAWRDNVFVERLWRSVKYEEVYLRAYDSVGEARASIGRYLDFYNGRRPHSSLDGTTPDKAYFTLLPLRLAA